MEHPLRTYRHRKNIRMDDMGKRLGVQDNQVSRIETGVRTISPSMALKIHAATDGEVAKWDLRPDIWEAPGQATGASA